MRGDGGGMQCMGKNKGGPNNALKSIRVNCFLSKMMWMRYLIACVHALPLSITVKKTRVTSSQTKLKCSVWKCGGDVC